MLIGDDKIYRTKIDKVDIPFHVYIPRIQERFKTNKLIGFELELNNNKNKYIIENEEETIYHNKCIFFNPRQINCCDIDTNTRGRICACSCGCCNSNCPAFKEKEKEIKKPKKDNILDKCIPSYCALKDDCTIGNNGFEIYSLPLPFSYIKKTTTLSSIDKLRSIGFGSNFETGDTGLHLHVSLNHIINQQHRFNIVKFIYENKSWFWKYSRRKYTGDYSDPDVYNNLNSVLNRISNNNIYDTRQGYLNLKTNHQTMEFRMFGGFASSNWIRKCYDVVQSLIEYSKETGDTNKYSWFNFINKNKHTYNYLHKYLQKGNA